jgi:hypothetical protein
VLQRTPKPFIAVIIPLRKDSAPNFGTPSEMPTEHQNTSFYQQLLNINPIIYLPIVKCANKKDGKNEKK